jgi:hypothetical protein
MYCTLHSMRENLLLTLLIHVPIKGPILDRTMGALGIGAEPHGKTPGLCPFLSSAPLHNHRLRCIRRQHKLHMGECRFQSSHRHLWSNGWTDAACSPFE